MIFQKYFNHIMFNKNIILALDTLLAEGTTDEEGTFTLQGAKTEVTTIDPKVNVGSFWQPG